MPLALLLQLTVIKLLHAAVCLTDGNMSRTYENKAIVEIKVY
jgi:hypothetical protein